MPSLPEDGTKKGEERGSQITPVVQEFSMGAPLWLKFAGFTCLLLSFFLVVLGMTSSRLAQQEINSQINNMGRKLVYFVGVQIGPFWLDLIEEHRKKSRKKWKKN